MDVETPLAGGTQGRGAVLALLTLADGRFPAGGHVHSAGVEAAVADGRVRDAAGLAAYVEGRVRTAGLVEAALVAATVHRLTAPAAAPPGAVLAELDAEASARLPAAPLRDASRRLGRQLVRAARRCWPAPVLDAVAARPDGAHLPVALGATAVAAGLDAPGAARLSLHHTITTPAQAAVRLLGLDPFEVAAVGARLAGIADQVAEAAVTAAGGPLAALPADTGPLVEVAAVEHAARDARLFAT